MNPQLQSTHKPDGAHHGQEGHRPLNEEVLQSAVEVAKAEVLLTGHHAKQHQKHADFGLMQRVQEKATRFVLLEPMKASMLAAGSGAVLALLLEQGLKRLFRVVR